MVDAWSTASLTPPLCQGKGQWTRAHAGAFEEYRYDALGRRVWVRARRWCDNTSQDAFCNYDTVRRTLWDGAHTLLQIQMPDTDAARESDGPPPQEPRLDGNFDPNPLLGRTLYTHGTGVDQPLGAIRMGFADHPYGKTYQRWGEFAVLPLWDVEGGAPYAVFADGTRTRCLNTGRCLDLRWLLEWMSYGAQRNAFVASGGTSGTRVWLGTVLEDREDASGLLYRRNRYYNPEQGRFTQEDPIGLAGGLNLYGYAGGDPVNYSDPFGLYACPPDCGWRDAAGLGAGFVPVVSELNDAATVLTGRDNITGEDIGLLGRGAAVVGAVSPVSGGQLRAGAKAGRVVIGETMDRVIPYAKRLGASWYKARGKNPANWMRNNEAWLRRQMRAGKEIIDIGVDPARTNRSDFYKREIEMLEKANYPVTRP